MRTSKLGRAALGGVIVAAGLFTALVVAPAADSGNSGSDQTAVATSSTGTSTSLILAAGLQGDAEVSWT